MTLDYLPKKKETFLAKSGPVSNPDIKHLFIIVTNTCKNNQNLVVPVSSIKEGRYYDPTCTIDGVNNEHSFIRDNSYIYYKYIETKMSSVLIKCIESSIFIKKEDCPDELFKRVCLGIMESPHTPRWAKKQYASWPE